MTIAVRPATVDEVSSVVAPITMAFASDPLLRWIFPDPHVYLDAFPELAGAIAGPAIEHGTAHCADTFAGAALWLPPGVHPDVAAIGALFQRTMTSEHLADVLTMVEAKDRYHPDEPYWYLHMIGVDPRHQSAGVGSRLLGHALDAIDREHVTAFLDSSNPVNVPFYERHGFTPVATVEVAGAPPVTPMIRRAR